MLGGQGWEDVGCGVWGEVERREETGFLYHAGYAGNADLNALIRLYGTYARNADETISVILSRYVLDRYAYDVTHDC